MTIALKGGNRQNGFTDPLELEVDVKDLDNPDEKLTYNWSCINLNKNETCKTFVGDIIYFNDSNYNVIPPKRLEPFNVYQFQVIGSN
jgi:hypothetical protein